MDKDKILSILARVKVIRTKSVPLVTHLMREYGMNWYTAKRWHDILSEIPLEMTFNDNGEYVEIPSTEVSKFSPKREERLEAIKRERDAGASDKSGVAVDSETSSFLKRADGTFAAAKIQGHTIVVGETLKGYGEILRITQNQFGDYVIRFGMEDGSEYEVSEFHLDMNAIRSR
jgi:hypothetical protein